MRPSPACVVGRVGLWDAVRRGALALPPRRGRHGVCVEGTLTLCPLQPRSARVGRKRDRALHPVQCQIIIINNNVNINIININYIISITSITSIVTNSNTAYRL